MPILGTSAEHECDDYPEPLTPCQAQNLRLKSPMISPWWVITVQLGLGVVYVLLVAFWSQHKFGVVSAACGVGVVWVPALVFVAVISRGSAQLGVHTAALVFFVGELVKLVLSVALIFLSVWWLESLNWQFFLGGMFLSLKVYWWALAIRPKPRLGSGLVIDKSLDK
jgi:ATP synthase protein I